MDATSATELFAFARGEAIEHGSHRCFYCGGSCSGRTSAKSHVKKTFTAIASVAGGDAVCGGCIAAMQEKATIRMASGEVRENQKVRCYSWVVTSTDAVAATKAHREYLLGQCLAPPPPPYVICISDSGQKHLLYLSVVVMEKSRTTVTLEGERISFRPHGLQERLSMCKCIAAAVGRPALRDSLTINQRIAVVEYHGDTALLDKWDMVRDEPLSRLAVWFTPAKKDCANEYPRGATAR